MNTFPKNRLQKMVDFVWDNPYTDFYQMHWKNIYGDEKPVISDRSDWGKIPLLTRADLNEEKDPSKRAFIKPEDREVLHTTSGTSGSEVFMFWRECSGTIDVTSSPMNQMKTCMFIGAYEKAPRVIVWLRGKGITTLTGDSRNLKYSAQLAQTANIDSLYIPPTLALLFGEELVKNGHATSIKVIFLWGAQCSDTTYARLKKLFPNVYFVFTYGQSEAGGSICTSTDTCINPNTIMHVNTGSQFVEIVDGEVILTNLDFPTPTPLIRYRTGDAAVSVGEVCPCGRNDPRLEILGRINGDFLRIAGGELRAEELERVMKPFDVYIEHNYFLKVKEVSKNGKVQPTFTLHIQMRPRVDMEKSVLEMHIYRHFLEHMRLSQNMLLHDALRTGLIGSLDVRIGIIEPTLKHKRLIYIS